MEIIGSRRKQTAGVGTAGLDGELVKGTAQALEVEALVVLVLVRVGRAASSAAVLDIFAGGLGSVGDLAGRVVDASTSSRAAALKLGGSCADEGDEGEERGEELHRV